MDPELYARLKVVSGHESKARCHEKCHTNRGKFSELRTKSEKRRRNRLARFYHHFLISLDQLPSQHQDAVQRLAEVPGLGVDSAQQIIAEVGPTAVTFPSAKQLSSWVGASPGDDESAGVNHSHRSQQGNRHMRRILNQAANAAVKTKGSIFEIVYRRSVPRLGHNQAIGAIAHRQCRLIWLILHQGVRYEERGPAVTKQSRQRRMARMIRQLRSLGYRIEPPKPQPSQAQAQ